MKMKKKIAASILAAALLFGTATAAVPGGVEVGTIAYANSGEEGGTVTANISDPDSIGGTIAITVDEAEIAGGSFVTKGKMVKFNVTIPTVAGKTYRAYAEIVHADGTKAEFESSENGLLAAYVMQDKPITFNVTFKRVYAVTVPETTANGEVRTNVYGGVAPVGKMIAIYPTPDEGYEATVTVKDADNTTISVSKTGDNGYTFTMPAKPVSIEVTFTGGNGDVITRPTTPGEEEGDYTVTVTADEGGTATVDKSTADEGDTVTVTATPDSGKVVDGLIIIAYESTVTATPSTADLNEWTFTMPGTNVTVNVTFKDAPAGEPEPETPSAPSGTGSVSFGSTNSGDTSSDTTSTSGEYFWTWDNVVWLPSNSDAVEFTPTDVVVDEEFDDETAQVVNDIKIGAPEGTFPEDTQLVIKPNPAVTVEYVFALDISFELDGAAVQPANGATVTVALPIPSMFRNVAENRLMVFHFDNDVYTRVNDVTVHNGFISFNTTHFSTYVISTENLAASSAPESTSSEPAAANPNPHTGAAAAVVFPAAALASAVVIISKKKK